MKKIKSLSKISILLAISMIFISCGKNDVRNYREKVPSIKTDNGFHKKNIEINQPFTTEFRWTTPKEWIPEKNRSKLRIATFSIRQKDMKATCTLIPLHGNGGGLEANVRMWYGTLTGKDISEEGLKKILKDQRKFKTSSGRKGILIDFSNYEAKDKTSSMLISVITFPQKTLFIKMVGDKHIVKSNRDKFLNISKSVGIAK